MDRLCQMLGQYIRVLTGSHMDSSNRPSFPPQGSGHSGAIHIVVHRFSGAVSSFRANEMDYRRQLTFLSPSLSFSRSTGTIPFVWRKLETSVGNTSSFYHTEGSIQNLAAADDKAAVLSYYWREALNLCSIKHGPLPDKDYFRVSLRVK